MAKESKTFPFVLFILVGIVSFALGALLMYFVSMKATSDLAPAPAAASSSINSFFDGVSSTVQGKIIEVNGEMLTIVNNKDQIQTFKISPTVFISKPGQDGKVATASGEKSAIEENKNVVLSLAVQDDQYVIMSVIYPMMPQTPQ